MIDYKKVSECESLAYCQGWNEAVNAIIADRFMVVECIGVSKVFKGRVNVGERYLIDRDSIYIDHDGDVFGSVYKMDDHLVSIGNMYLKNFKSVR